MKLKLKFFASWREIVGQSEIDWPWREGQSAEDVLTELIAEYPALAGAARNSLVMVNRRYADRQAALQAGDEVAFIPPVGGGTA
jgi:MoaD family protein